MRSSLKLSMASSKKLHYKLMWPDFIKSLCRPLNWILSTPLFCLSLNAVIAMDVEQHFCNWFFPGNNLWWLRFLNKQFTFQTSQGRKIEMWEALATLCNELFHFAPVTAYFVKISILKFAWNFYLQSGTLSLSLSLPLSY